MKGCGIPLILSLALTTGCGELTKLIPSKKTNNPIGLQEQELRSSFQPSELRIDGDGQLYGLRGDLPAASAKFAATDDAVTTKALLEFEQLTSSTKALRPIADSRPDIEGDFFSRLPPLPQLRELTNDLATYARDTPNIKTDDIAALDPDQPAPLVTTLRSGIFELSGPELQISGFRLSESPRLAFKGLATTFSENSSLASDSGVTAASERTIDDISVLKARSVLTFARSLQPGNEFQILLECVNVSLQLPNSEGTILSHTWPRLLVREGTQPSGSMLDRPKKTLGKSATQGSTDASVLVGEARPGLLLTPASTETPGNTRSVLLTAPPRQELIIGREPAAVAVTWGENAYDGANSSRFFSLFHEARKLFFYQFFATAVDTFWVQQSLAQFRLPFNATSTHVTSQRNEFGLWRKQLSLQQQDFFQNDPSRWFGTPPDDRWTKTDGIKAFGRNGQRQNPLAAPETSENGLLAIDPTRLGDPRDGFFLQPTPRSLGSDSILLSRDKFADLENLCRRAFL